MIAETEWETSQLVALVTTYIVGIENVLKPVMLRGVMHASMQVDDVYATFAPPLGRALEHADVNLPGE